MRWQFSDLRLRGGVGGPPLTGFLWLMQCFACLAVAWVLAPAWWWLAAPDSVALVPKTLPSLVTQSKRVMARHFFDVVDESQQAEGVVMFSPDAVNTRWRLIGTYVGSGAYSRAVLLLEGASEAVLAQVGDPLSTGHEVVEVRADSVVLSKDGQRGELALRPEADDTQDQGQPVDRFGTAEPAPFNKDSR